MRCVLVLLALAIAVPVHAQNMLWRVEQLSPTELIPGYDGGASPFPLLVAPEQPKEPKVEVPLELPPPVPLVNARAARLLEEARTMLQNDTFVQPDASTIRITGYLKGENGPQILLRGKWLRVGDQVTVPVQEVTRFIELFAELQEIDISMSKQLQREQANRLALVDAQNLKIREIRSTSVVLIDRRGETYEIPLNVRRD